MADAPSRETRELLRRTYDGFNRRAIDSALAVMQPDVDWPNMIDNVRAVGHDAVREYWQRQFATIDPHVEPEQMRLEDDGRVVVDVHQVIRLLDGSVRDDRMVQHVYTIRDGLVARMDIQEVPS